jgi:hypothetical protein
MTNQLVMLSSIMDRAMIEAHLAQCEEHIALGVRIIDRQRAVAAVLERGGHDTTPAKRLLQTFEDLQIEHVAHRDRLADELAALDGGGDAA